MFYVVLLCLFGEEVELFGTPVYAKTSPGSIANTLRVKYWKNRAIWYWSSQDGIRPVHGSGWRP